MTWVFKDNEKVQSLIDTEITEGFNKYWEDYKIESFLEDVEPDTLEHSKEVMRLTFAAGYLYGTEDEIESITSVVDKVKGQLALEKSEDE